MPACPAAAARRLHHVTAQDRPAALPLCGQQQGRISPARSSQLTPPGGQRDLLLPISLLRLRARAGKETSALCLC